MKKTERDPLEERSAIDFGKGVRGRYNNLLAKGTNVAILDPALLPSFPDSQSVNDALHAFLSLPAAQREAALAQQRTRPEAFTVASTEFDPRSGQNSEAA